MLPFEAEGLVEATVGEPGEGSWFVARADDGALFDVHDAVPGDRVLLRPDPARAGRARLEALLAPGPERVEPFCPLVGRCGGCHWQRIAPAAQRALRLARTRRALAAAGIDDAGVAFAAPAAPRTERHRARMRFQTAFENGASKVGMHRLGERATLDVPDCPALSPEAARVYAFLRDYLRERRPRGLTGFELTALPDAPGALVHLNPRDVEPEDWPALGAEMLEIADGLIAGVAVRPEAPDPRLGAAAVLGRTPQGLPVAAAARGFVQANLAAAETLAAEVVRAAAPADGEPLLELYGGAAFLGWRLAAAGARVVSVESDPSARRAAELLPPPPRGALRHERGDAREAFDEATRGEARTADREDAAPRAGDVRGTAPRFAEAFETIVADPPRAGLGPLAADLAARGPLRIVLVSCSLAGLARDAAALNSAYAPRRAAVLDLFPHTRHAEVVAQFERRKR